MDILEVIETKDFPFYWRIKVYDKNKCVYCGGNLARVKKPVDCLKCMRCDRRYSAK